MPMTPTQPSPTPVRDLVMRASCAELNAYAAALTIDPARAAAFAADINAASDGQLARMGVRSPGLQQQVRGLFARAEVTR